MTERHLDQDLKALKEELLAMAGHVERSIQYATDALIEWDSSKFSTVDESEHKINVAHKQVDEDCVAHHSAEHHPDATSIEKAGTGHGDHAGPDCCKSSACRCACVHACASALPARLHVSVQLALGLDVMPLPLGHAAPALPHLIRPPIG